MMRRRRYARARFEPLENRICLTSSGFAEHLLEAAPTELAGVLDVDGDGDLDMLSRYRQGMAWHENVDGMFSDPVAVLEERLSGVRVADIDGDGDDDIIAQRYYDNRRFDTEDLYWFENLDNSPYFAAAHKLADYGRGGTVSVEIGDPDGDGDVDVFAFSSSKLTWIENRDNGSEFMSHELSIPETTKLQFVAGDLNNDGADELVLSGEFADVYVYSFPALTNSLLTQLRIETESVGLTIVDFDQDGLRDIVVGEGSSVSFLKNDGGGTSFTSTRDVQTNAPHPFESLRVV